MISMSSSKWGNAPAHSLFERIQAELKPDVQVPWDFIDYTVSVQDSDLPNGVELISRV